jgi:hypothetical protein
MYDSSAQSASIRRPGVDEPWTPAIAVAGEVDAGWKVTVGAKELDLDRHHRFTAEVPAPEDGVLAIRLAHRHKGVQIYLRRNPSRPR